MSILPQALCELCRNGLRACLPNSCVLCGQDSDDLVCHDCEDDLPTLPAPNCPRCAEPISAGGPCGHCLRQPPHFDSTTALYRYDFPMDRLVHALKYDGRLSLAEWFGSRLARQLGNRPFDRIIPMPLHPDRLRERGFNQAAEIARTVGRLLGIPLDIVLCRRSRPSLPQARLPLGSRSANVRGIFECIGDLSEQHILLLDDVMTSGATLDECARTLKLHGAATVDAAVIARALRN